jgi:hypothetical protein
MAYFSDMKASTRQQEENHIPPSAFVAQKWIKTHYLNTEEKLQQFKCTVWEIHGYGTKQNRTECIYIAHILFGLCHRMQDMSKLY